MSKNQLATRNLTAVGEEISHELGAKMVKDFQDAHPNEIPSNYIGKAILENILAQPGCAGIRFYNGINELGRKTLVYVGLDHTGNIITEFTGVNAAGELVKEKGIVADRSESNWHWSED